MARIRSTAMTEKPITKLEAGLSLARDRLSRAGHRVTLARQSAFAILQISPAALSHDDLAMALTQAGVLVDRVTLYRVLEWLVDHQFAHRIATESRAWQFNAVLEEGIEHGHFECRNCERIFCLEEPAAALPIHLPKGFEAEVSKLLVSGKCSDCLSQLRRKAGKLQ